MSAPIFPALLRRQPPVYSRIPVDALVTGFLDSLSATRAKRQEIRGLAALRAAYPGRSVTFVDSGTSALAMAILSSATMHDALVAVPAYCCPDVATAAMAAGARLVLYDTDPAVLAPDMRSLERCLIAGATHVVIAHLYGRVIDIPSYAEAIAAAGAVLIEDAAQHAGGTLGGRRGGQLADWSVLSFGRGKGLNAGGGGALLGPPNAKPIPDVPSSIGRSLSHAISTTGMAMLSFPSVFGLVAAIPALGVGETRFHAPSQPADAARSVPGLVARALALEPGEIAVRRRHEAAYEEALEGAMAARVIGHAPGAESGALRFPVLLGAQTISPTLSALGVTRAYPRTLAQYEAIRPWIINADDTFVGAEELAGFLSTLPTHPLLRDAERERILDEIGRRGGRPTCGLPSAA